MGGLKEGDILQKYLIERKVAKGGMGWLFKAQHITLKMPVAVKVLLPHHAEDPKLRGRFLNEARIQCRLKHPYIVQVTDTIEFEDNLGIVMEWVEGGDLLGYMQRQGELLSFHQIHAVMGPVLEALQYAHDKGVVHRDIKPDNILLQEDGGLIPKVSDFGLAKLEEGLSKSWTKDGEALGSIRYMAPEQIRNTKMVDQRADIYSLGIVLYFMATGGFPFTGTPQELLYHHICQTPPRPQERNPDISFQFEDVILCCLQKDPDNRFQSCMELAAALQEVSYEYPLQAHQTAPSPVQRLRHHRLQQQANQRRTQQPEPPSAFDPELTAEVHKATPPADGTRPLFQQERAQLPENEVLQPPQPIQPPSEHQETQANTHQEAALPSHLPPTPPKVPPASRLTATPLPRTALPITPPTPLARTATAPLSSPLPTPITAPLSTPITAPRPSTPPLVEPQRPFAAPPPAPAKRPLLPPSSAPAPPFHQDPSYLDDEDDDAATVLNYQPTRPRPVDDDDEDATFIHKK